MSGERPEDVWIWRIRFVLDVVLLVALTATLVFLAVRLDPLALIFAIGSVAYARRTCRDWKGRHHGE